MDWDKLRIFHEVSALKSFTLAAQRLHLSQSAISRQIKELERQLKTSLFRRYTRGLGLTEQGLLLREVVDHVFTELKLVENRILESQQMPSGPLRVATTFAFGSTWLPDRLHHYSNRYPEVQLSLRLTDEVPNLMRGEADIAILMKLPPHAGLLSRKLGNVHHRIYGSKTYLEKYGVPQTYGELDQHRLIVFGDEGPNPASSDLNWILQRTPKSALQTGQAGLEPKLASGPGPGSGPGPTPESALGPGPGPDGRGSNGPPARGLRVPALKLNNQSGILRAVRAGFGLASLPEFVMRESDENLVPILPEVVGPVSTAYLVYAPEHRYSKRVQTFKNFMIEATREALSGSHPETL